MIRLNLAPKCPSHPAQVLYSNTKLCESRAYELQVTDTSPPYVLSICLGFHTGTSARAYVGVRSCVCRYPHERGGAAAHVARRRSIPPPLSRGGRALLRPLRGSRSARGGEIPAATPCPSQETTPGSANGWKRVTSNLEAFCDKQVAIPRAAERERARGAHGPVWTRTGTGRRCCAAWDDKSTSLAWAGRGPGGPTRRDATRGPDRTGPCARHAAGRCCPVARARVGEGQGILLSPPMRAHAPLRSLPPRIAVSPGII